MQKLIDEANGKCRPGTKALYRRPYREHIGREPAGTAQDVSKPSMRGIKDLLSVSSVEKSRKAHGITKKNLEAALRSQMHDAEIDARGLRMLGNSREMELIRKTLSDIEKNGLPSEQ